MVGAAGLEPTTRPLSAAGSNLCEQRRRGQETNGGIREGWPAGTLGGRRFLRPGWAGSRSTLALGPHRLPSTDADAIEPAMTQHRARMAVAGSATLPKGFSVSPMPVAPLSSGAVVEGLPEPVLARLSPRPNSARASNSSGGSARVPRACAAPCSCRHGSGTARSPWKRLRRAGPVRLLLAPHLGAARAAASGSGALKRFARWRYNRK